MPETMTYLPVKRSTSWLARVGQSLRAYWTGAFSLKDPALNKLYDVGTRTLAGPVVTEFTAFTCAAFWDGVNQISSDVAKLPLNLKKRNALGGSDDFVASKVYKLLKYSPNPYTRSMVFRRTLTMHALVYGNGYAEIVRDAVGRPSALYIVQPWRVAPKLEGTSLVYIVDGETRVPAADMLHLTGLGEDGIMGWNMVNVAREALGLALASQQFAAAFFGNGTRFGGVLSSDADLDQTQIDGLRAEINKVHEKADKAFRLLILSNGFTYTPTGVKPSEAQMKEMREQQVVEIARFLNMPPHKLKELSRSTNNNIEHQDLEYYKGCLLTWVTLWEEELNAKLVPSLEQGIQFFKHNANAFLRGDIKSRYEALGIARDKGIINADEWRDLEDMNPQPDGQGKVYLVQSAQVPVGKLSELVDAQIAETQAKSKPTATAADVARAEARADRAEQLAAEAQQQATSLGEQLAIVKALGSAREDEIETLTAALAKQQETATALTVLASDVRAEADVLRQAKDALAERAHTLEDEQSKLRQLIAVAEEEVSRLNAACTGYYNDLMETRSRETEARTRADEAQAAAAEAKAAAEAAGTENGELTRKALEAEQAAMSARVEMEAAIELRARAEQAATEAAAEMNRANEELERLTTASQEDREKLTQQIALMESTLSQTQTSHQTELDALNATVARMEQERAAIEADRLMLAQRAEQAEAARKAQRAAELERQGRVIAAHRALVVDAVGRMARREAEQARKRQASPEKLRTWVKAFDALHAEICVEALLPAVRAHLEWKGASDEPRTVATALVTQRLSEFRDAMLSVADGDAEDFHAVLGKTLERWETEQPERIADRLMQESIAYLRSQE